MAFLFYLVIVVVSVFGVLLEMDVLVQPGRSIERTTLSLPQATPKVAAKPELMPVKPAVALGPKKTPAKTAMANPADAAGKVPASIAASEPAKPAVSNLCDIDACTRAYRTFNPADCTFAIRVGERVLCTRGTPPQQVAAPAATEAAKEQPKTEIANANPTDQATPAGATTKTPDTQVDTGAPQSLKPLVSNRCDVETCSRAYRTFDPADCTFAIRVGERQLCTRGTPPQQVAAAPATAASDVAKEQSKTETASATPANQANAPAATPIDTAGNVPASIVAPEPTKPAVPNLCDVDACSQAYRSFSPSDCTYMPRFGVRELCTKGTPPQQAAAAPAATDAANEQPKTETASATPTDQASAPAAATAKTADAAPTADTQVDTGAPQALKPLVSNRCDIEACSHAYRTFDPADCTFAIRVGERQLCTRGTASQHVAAAPAAAADEQPKTEAASATPTDQVNAPAAATAKIADAAPTATETPAESAPPQPLKPLVSDLCDVAACDRAYHSFNPADCTFMPRFGVRALCTKGTPPQQVATTPPAPAGAQSKPEAIATNQTGPATGKPADANIKTTDAVPTADTRAETVAPLPLKPLVSNRCDVAACRHAYYTFNPADCTFAIRVGERKLCTRGTPPAASAEASAAKPANAAKPVDVGTNARCNVQACAEAYFSFNPQDCTYQPSDGPRRLCER